MKQILTKSGKVVLVDDEDYAMLSQYTWWISIRKSNIYVYTNSPETGKHVYMHRLVMGATGRYNCVDHIDGDGLNNQKHNLRLSTISQNCKNRKIFPGGTSKYKGVSWNKANRKWFAQIRNHYTKMYIGYFDDEKEAALAYNQAALKYHGEFATINEI